MSNLYTMWAYYWLLICKYNRINETDRFIQKIFFKKKFDILFIFDADLEF